MTLEKSHGSSTRYRLQTSTDIGTTSREDNSAELDEKPVPKTALVPKTAPVPKTDKSSTKNGTGVVPKTVPEPTKNLNNLKDKRYRSLELPDGDDEYIEQVREFIDHRCNLKKPVTQNALGRFLKLVEKTSQEIGLTDCEIIAEVIDAGWQSFQPHWLKNRLEKPNGSKPNQPGITRNPSAVERVKARRRAAEQAMGTVGPDDRDVRAQVDIEHGRGAYRHMGEGTS